jgi:FlaA1/EpsC-like NDP-sugar epimerase
MSKINLRKRALSKWFIFLIDQVIICWSLTISLFVVLEFHFNEILRGYFFIYTGIYLLITTIVFIRMRIHTGILRYSNLEDIYKIFSAVLLSSIIYWCIVNFGVKYYLHSEWHKFSLSVLLNFFISSSLLISLRIYVKNFFSSIKPVACDGKEVVLIYGSEESSILLKQALEVQQENKFNVLGFLDDDTDKVNKRIQQKRVFSSADLATLKSRYNVGKLIITGDAVSTHHKKIAIEKCMELGIRVSNIPPSDQWLYGKLSLSQMKDLQINDLLLREPIVLERDNIAHEITNKCILITGAAGSIGSELVRQIIAYKPTLLIMCDQAESPLHELQLEITDKYQNANVAVFLADIQNSNRLRALFSKYHPQIVFHAAAYKHVPLMESNPVEAIMTNVLGTKNLADISVEFNVEKFVMISTDKAVNPTNVMGASKRIAEIYIQSLNSNLNIINNRNYTIPNAVGNSTKFITTRFGNVLGSNGSVIPRFKAQIENGGPVTVTDPEITRFFMTIPEAVDLVMEAASMGRGGEIFVFDMGCPIKISDLAEKMIRLAGLVPDKDIKIVYTGLRPGEKMYEELLNKDEANIPTHHAKIKIAKVVVYPFSQVENVVKALLLLNRYNNEYDLVRMMKKIVPEFISNNSEFQQLDLKTVE